jgi:hypothetical protein
MAKGRTAGCLWSADTDHRHQIHAILCVTRSCPTPRGPDQMLLSVADGIAGRHANCNYGSDCSDTGCPEIADDVRRDV